MKHVTQSRADAEFDRLFGLGKPASGGVYARSAANVYELEGPKDLAIWALAHGARVQEAARDAGVSPGTVAQWKRCDQFRASVEALRSELLEPLRDEIRGSLSDAFHVVRENMLSADPKLAQRAAEYVLDRFGGAFADMAAASQTQVNVQLNVDAADVQAEARRRLAAYSTVVNVTESDDVE